MEERFWDIQMETLPTERRRLLREHRLHWQVRRCWDGSRFYRDRLERAGLEPASFGGATDWQRLPVLRAADFPTSETAAELMASWAVAPESWWGRLDEATGLPPRVATDGDAIQRADLTARALWAAGARTGQSLVLWPGRPRQMPRDPFCDAIVAGALRIGMSVVDDASPPGPDGAAQFVAAIAVSSAAPEPVLAADRVLAQIVWCSGFETEADARRRNSVVLSLPLVAPTLGYTCLEGEWLHWNDDHFLIEVVEPGTGLAAQASSPGALVITDLAREGSPLLRFWTGLETVLLDEPCLCGRTSSRSPYVRSLA